LVEIVGGFNEKNVLDILLDRLSPTMMKRNFGGLDLRKFGSACMQRFDLVFERLVIFATGMGNIRDVIPFPNLHKMPSSKTYSLTFIGKIITFLC